MADEAFALSPISARPAQPSEQDYEAIREAFMETSRGRWFLGEYARRNRNADTRMVLDAVARLQETIAAQRQVTADNRLTEALAGLVNAVDQAAANASAAFDGLALEENLAPIRKGTRIMKEISWRWREIGADSRICDMIDSQVNSINASCDQLSAFSPKSALSSAFDLIKTWIAGFGHSERQLPKTDMNVNRLAVSPPADAMPPPEMAPAQEAAAETVVEAPAGPPDAQSAASIEIATVPTEAADADDEAVLDMVAFEMAAADPANSDGTGELTIEEAEAALPPALEPAIVAEVPAPVAASADPRTEPSSRPAVESQTDPAGRVSLGSTIIARGIMKNASPPANDPLAPIRRMSQAEKIAFFS